MPTGSCCGHEYSPSCGGNFFLRPSGKANGFDLSWAGILLPIFCFVADPPVRSRGGEYGTPAPERITPFSPYGPHRARPC